MKPHLSVFVFVIFATFSWASVSNLIPSASLFHAPQYDSAIVHTQRIGPNFAYSTFERHGVYPELAPIVQNELYHVNAVPFTLPTSQYVYLHNPILSSVGSSKPNVEQSKETEVEKIDDDTVSIESA